MKAYLITPCLILLSILFSSCVRNSSPAIYEKIDLLPAPSGNLPAKEIMDLQGITSIRFVSYDSVVSSQKHDTAFNPTFEYYIDEKRVKIIQYNPLTITVFAFEYNIAWNYYDGKYSYMNIPNVFAAYSLSVKEQLGSWLNDSWQFLYSESLDGKQCQVFGDNSGLTEWVWTKYRLPIQKKRVGSGDIYQITYTKKMDIEINKDFPDSIFIMKN